MLYIKWCDFIFFLHLIFLIFTGMKSFYNVALVSAAEQNESAVSIYRRPLFLNFFPI